MVWRGQDLAAVGVVASRILAVMPNQRELYASPNGDRWHLIRADDTGDIFVRHTANEASGGNVIDFAIPVFLGLGRHGPEHQELWRLIGTLVDQIT